MDPGEDRIRLVRLLVLGTREALSETLPHVRYIGVYDLWVWGSVFFRGSGFKFEGVLFVQVGAFIN